MNKTLWIMCGVPGSGKTWTAKNVLIKGLGWRYISRDEVRYSMIKEEDEYFSKENKVFAAFINKIKSAFEEDGVFNVIADATHLNWASRRKLLAALGQDEKRTWDIIPVVMKTSLEKSIEQNELREGRARVSRSVLRHMTAQMTDPQNDNFDYTAIMYINHHEKEYTIKPRFMYHKNDIKMKEIPIKEVLKK